MKDYILLTNRINIYTITYHNKMTHNSRIFDCLVFSKHYQAVEDEDLDKLVSLYSKTGLIGNRECLDEAVKHNNLAIVKYLIECDIKPNMNMLYTACNFEKVDLAIYLCSGGLIPDIRCHALASSFGNLELLKYFTSIDVPYNHVSMRRAMSGGHINVVKYLHEEIGVPIFNYHLCNIIARNPKYGSMMPDAYYYKLFLYVIKIEGIKLTEEVFRKAAHSGRIDIMKYFYDNEYPIAKVNIINVHHEKTKIHLHNRGLLKNYICDDNCEYCSYSKAKEICRLLISEHSYGSWLCNDSLDRLIQSVYRLGKPKKVKVKTIKVPKIVVRRSLKIR